MIFHAYNYDHAAQAEVKILYTAGKQIYGLCAM